VRERGKEIWENRWGETKGNRERGNKVYMGERKREGCRYKLSDKVIK